MHYFKSFYDDSCVKTINNVYQSERYLNMNKYMLAIFIVITFSVISLTGCEKIIDTGMVVSPDDGMTETLKVGLIHPYPNYTSFGKGAELAQAEINASGGILGMQVELVYKEEETDTVVDYATALIQEDEVVAILGPLFSSHAVKVGPITTVPVLLGATRSEVTVGATDPHDLMFLVAGSNVLQAKLLAKVVVEQLEKNTAGMIWQDKDVYSEGFVQSFKTSLEELGGNVVVEETYTGNDVMMFDTQLTAVKDANPDVLLLASFPGAVPRIMKQARDMGITSTFIGSDGWDDPLISSTLDDNAHVDGYYCTNLDPTAVSFNKAYMTKYGSVDGIAATGYDALQLLKIAVESVGSADDPWTIRDAIAEIKNYEGATSISSFDMNRNPVKSVGVRQILDGIPQDDIIEATPE